MNIICISPLKKLDSPYAEAVREYEKRLGRYCKIKLFSAKSAPPPSPAAEILTITSGLAGASMLSSEEFAAQLAQYGLNGQTRLHFILADSPAVSENCLSLSYAKLSPPLLTVLLYEQIYRAFRIIHQHSYHK